MSPAEADLFRNASPALLSCLDSWSDVVAWKAGIAAQRKAKRIGITPVELAWNHEIYTELDTSLPRPELSFFRTSQEGRADSQVAGRYMTVCRLLRGGRDFRKAETRVKRLLCWLLVLPKFQGDPHSLDEFCWLTIRKGASIDYHRSQVTAEFVRWIKRVDRVLRNGRPFLRAPAKPRERKSIPSPFWEVSA